MKPVLLFRFAALPALLLLGGCPTVTPNPNAKAGPDLVATAFDWNDRTTTDFTGPRRNPDAGFPESYAGLLQDQKNESFDTTVGIRAHDNAGVQSLTVRFAVDTCDDQFLYTLTSFNNGATSNPSGAFTLTASGPQAPVDLAIPTRISAADIATIKCNDGHPSPYPGTIVITANADNFGSGATLGYFYIQIGASPLPNQ